MDKQTPNENDFNVTAGEVVCKRHGNVGAETSRFNVTVKGQYGT